ncbi:MAG: endonuclease/exonuclease/phosphatase family protein [Verrucomicrobiota bacterium JB025]
MNLQSRPLTTTLVVAAGLIAAGAGICSGETVRIMAANLTSGNYQSYDPGDGIRIFQGLDPDVVLIQEFNYDDNSSADLRNFVDDAFGTEFSYSIEGGDEQIPNGIISRYPILESGEWDDSEVANRDFAWARIDIPGDKDLWAVSVHLLTSGSGVRNTEASALVNYIQSHVPADDYLVIGGDFNTDSFGESCLATLSTVVDTSGRPTDQNGDTGTNSSRSKPYDQVLPEGELAALEVPVTISGHPFTYTEGLVFDSRVFTPLTAVSPVESGDSAASNMQHMGVIRDFLIDDAQATEPADYPTDFAATSTTGAITLTWTDVATTPVPDGYQLIVSTSPSITAPTDGVAITDDPDLGDGLARVTAAPGQQTVTFSGLPPETTYHATIFPYTLGDAIDYKTDETPATASVSTPAEASPAPDAPVIAQILYPHSTGVSILWNPVVNATAYSLDISQDPGFSGGAATTLLSEGFDASDDVPDGWTDNGSAKDTVASHVQSTPNCRAMAAGDTLETPAVDHPAAISFFVDASNGGNGNTATISYSIDNGTWQPLASFTASTTGATTTIDCTSSPDLSGQTKVRFRFEADFNTWYLDDVAITGAAGPGFVTGYQNLPLGNATRVDPADLSPDTTYYFRLRAANDSATSPDSATGTFTTTATGTPYSVWADAHQLPTADFTSDADNDSLPDFHEYLFATDPAAHTPPAEVSSQTITANGILLSHRRSLAPGITWHYLGGTDPSALSPLAAGSGYEILSVENQGDYEQVTVLITPGTALRYFIRLRATLQTD